MTASMLTQQQQQKKDEAEQLPQKFHPAIKSGAQGVRKVISAEQQQDGRHAEPDLRNQAAD